MEWFGTVLAENAPMVVLLCAVWWQLNGRLSVMDRAHGRMRERLVRIETEIGVQEKDRATES